MDILKSPVMHLNDLWMKQKEGTMLVFKLATYKRPGDGKHDCDTFTRGSVLIPTLAKIAESLPKNTEVGVSSRVGLMIGGTEESWHIPMIDFNADVGVHHASWACDALETEFPDLKLTLYHTGHSYHAYGDRLMTGSEWLQWNAKLLLVDPADAFMVAADHRWVGFSLTRGENFLRLSHNAESSSPIRKVQRDSSGWSEVKFASSYKASSEVSAPAATDLEKPFARHEGERATEPPSSGFRY